MVATLGRGLEWQIFQGGKFFENICIDNAVYVFFFFFFGVCVTIFWLRAAEPLDPAL